MRDHGLLHQAFEGCKVGLKVQDGPEIGMPLRKPWCIATNCHQLNTALATRRCWGEERCSEHARIEGAKTKSSGSYPKEMSELMVESYNAWHKESALKRAIEDEQEKKKVKAGAVVVENEDGRGAGGTAKRGQPCSMAKDRSEKRRDDAGAPSERPRDLPRGLCCLPRGIGSRTSSLSSARCAGGAAQHRREGAD